MNKLFSTLALVALAASAAFAQSEAFAVSARGFEDSAAEALRPFVFHDSFAGVGACGVLDIKTFRAWTVEEASNLAAPCLQAVGDKYAARMTVEGGLVAAASQGRPVEQGLVLKTDLIPGSMAHRDLAASLARRNGELLGHPVLLLTRGETAPAPVSAVQEALHHCILTDVVRDIDSSADFVKIYGSCLTHDADLKIAALRPAAGMTVDMTTAQDEKSVEALNGVVTVNAGKGPVTVVIVAYRAE
ncbi:MAG TPA: hypothetical protein VH309_09745 [Elusimicrobiota bacterium]|jgi:hypothetical protein|nr:hypothetical protein [Elusimicrobiota bacterium]